jgi:hypothetical protein
VEPSHVDRKLAASADRFQILQRGVFGALVGDFDKARIHHLAELLAVGAQRIGGTCIPMDVADL